MATCTDAVKEAVTNLGAVVSSRDVIDYIYKKYPDKPWKENTIQCHLYGLSVNHPSSRYYPAPHKQACLFYLGQGKYRLHDKEKDGDWIVDETGVHLVGEENTTENESIEALTEAAISFEKDLEEYIIRDLNQIEMGLKLYSEDNISGRQFNTDVGRIDILATDQKNDFVIIELKVGQANRSVLGQILGYMGWVRQKMANSKEVRGILIADDFDEKLIYATSEIKNLSLKKYRVNFSFEAVDLAS